MQISLNIIDIFIKHNRHFMSTYFLLDPFKLIIIYNEFYFFVLLHPANKHISNFFIVTKCTTITNPMKKS